jgi:hypothetical protein
MKQKKATPIIRAWITITSGFRAPIDGTSIWSDSHEHLKNFCDLFGLEPCVSEKFALHLTDANRTNVLEGMTLAWLQIILYELSLRGLDLAKVEGMEDRFKS